MIIMGEILYKIWATWTILVVLTAKVCFCVEKFWLPNLEWETAENWVGKQVPELNDHVVFPLDMRHAVGIGKSNDLSLAGIDLARSGSLVLARNGNLKLSELGESRRKTSQWLGSGHLFWADPKNWNGTSEAAPHLEQVPCRQDDIVLPGKKRTFSVLMPLKDIEVRSIRISDEKQPLGAWQWSDLENRREFEKGIFTVKYAEYSCDTCPCQDDPDDYYLEEICAIQRPKCGFAPCELPLTVEGHCCRYCGGRLFLPNKASLTMVQAAADEALEGYKEKLAWHVRRTWKGATEVLIKEKGDYSEIDILDAVENVKRTLLSMKIETLSMETAGAAMQDHRVAAALAPLFGTPLIILLFFFLAFLYFGYSYRHIVLGCTEIFSSIRDGVGVDKAKGGKPFGFARFENISEGNVQIADVVDANKSKLENKEEEGEDSTSGGRFENPLYRSKRKHKEEEEVLNMDAPLSMATLRSKVENQIEEVDVDIDK